MNKPNTKNFKFDTKANRGCAGWTLIRRGFCKFIRECSATLWGKNVEILVEETENEFQISVADDGKGIREEWKDKLFDWGFKHDNETGTGMGLYMVRQIVPSAPRFAKFNRLFVVSLVYCETGILWSSIKKQASKLSL
ncbi:MAG: sensor histidine kinase [Candidatus Korarchaeota archaeon]|nr:sensor histidine kinase [Candidatus Korarchaeota archaeon]NIU85554.1 hypothetical protein [Candidatus Thorarchaeota archaeon]NIW15665.1 hypothetical protein [Candidatus Thorarchaeota archaeon]NIW53595.1 hypothetical protein [Candidatus Korarchaeota archaeon]